MVDLSAPNQREALMAYLTQALADHTGRDHQFRLLSVSQLARSTRAAPWLLVVETGDGIRRFVLRFGDADSVELEYTVLRAMERVSVPTPRVYACDLAGASFQEPCFLSGYIQGESLLTPMRAGEPWAEELYIESVCALQSVTVTQLGSAGERLLPGQSAVDVLEGARAGFNEHPHPLADRVYSRLARSMPEFPELRFSNGDLYLDNFRVRNRELAGVIDFEHAGFSDPIYEFLLSFFVHPELRGRGTEERYCRQVGVDPRTLSWYRGLELFELLEWTCRTGRSFEGRTSETLRQDLEHWLYTRAP